jgi:hypothetical protein
MRFLILVGGGDDSLVAYHRELVGAGVLLAGDVSAGFWLIEASSVEEAAEWGRRVPREDVEVRQVAAW